MAELNQEKNNKLKNALGISPFFIDGSSLDPDRKTKEELAKSESLNPKRYKILRDTPSPEPQLTKQPESNQDEISKNVKKNKRIKKRSHSSDNENKSSSSSERRSRHKSKKHKLEVLNDRKKKSSKQSS
jgi:nucleolar GTPase/ATPase p130, putative (fragment)